MFMPEWLYDAYMWHASVRDVVAFTLGMVFGIGLACRSRRKPIMARGWDPTLVKGGRT